MPFNNVSIGARQKIKISSTPIVIDIKTFYPTMCPNPIELDISILSGEEKGHTFSWEVLSGPVGRFTPNRSSLFVTFDPLTNKSERVIRLTIDKGKELEQTIDVKLFDQLSDRVSISSNNKGLISTNIDRPLATGEVRYITEYEDYPLIGSTYKILDLSTSGIIESDIDWSIVSEAKVLDMDTWEYSQVDLSSKMVSINSEHRNILIVTYNGIGTTNIHSEDLTIVGTPGTGKVIFLEDRIDISGLDEGSLIYRLYGNGLLLRVRSDEPMIRYNNIGYENSNKRITTSEELDKTNNSSRIKISNRAYLGRKLINSSGAIIG